MQLNCGNCASKQISGLFFCPLAKTWVTDGNVCDRHHPSGHGASQRPGFDPENCVAHLMKPLEKE